MATSTTHAPAGFDESFLKKLSAEHSAEQQLWLSGFLYGLATARQQATALADLVPAPHAGKPARQLTILFGSQTGNSKKVANRSAERARQQGWEVSVADMNDYPLKNLKAETALLLVVSTQGEGVPPTAAEEFHRWLLSPRAPRLENLRFSVCALGDKSYLQFCQTGKDFDQRLAALGAIRIAERADCDTDFEETADHWLDTCLRYLGPVQAGATAVTTPAAALTAVAKHDRKHPFAAAILEKIPLNGRGSTKETHHLELSLEGSGLDYAPGDSLGVYATNADTLVEEVLDAAKWSGSENVVFNGKETGIAAVLKRDLELSVLSRPVLENFFNLSKDLKIKRLLDEPAVLKDYLWARDVADLLRDFETRLTPQDLVDALRKMPPRLYSIASSLAAHPGEAHLTVAAVRYENAGRQRGGVASTFLAERLETGDTIPVFVEHNEYFKLPADDATDIIMVGPGTGVAPFRAFVEERSERGATGKNWLFFGNPHFATDFLYQTEWLQYLKHGALDRLDVAFSRDQAEKVYVQHRLLERSRLIFERLEGGAFFYVCGDKSRMAADVQQALLTIVARESGKGEEHAAEYLKNLKKQRRFLEDVY